MKILAIETSCDDTSVAIVDCLGDIKHLQFTILSNIVSSQTKIHKRYGGVVPNLAAREHTKNMLPVFELALKQAKVNYKNFLQTIDLIAVTIGPGLAPSLLIGSNFAQDLSWALNKPIVGVNHLQGHIYSNLLNLSHPYFHLDIKFPAVVLLVSGGHTQLYLLQNLTKIKLVGETRDDAAGECFDKIAKLLNLGYPGGPIIAKMATKIKDQKTENKILSKFTNKIKLPRPLINSDDYDFSFAGLKTAVLYLVAKLKKNKQYNNKIKQQICFESQNAICECLISKIIKLAKETKAKTIMISGGVSANQELRRQLQEAIIKQNPKVDFYCPEFVLSTDNAAMVATAGYIQYLTKGTDDPKEMDINPNWRIS